LCEFNKRVCSPCVIYLKTGERYCGGTPYTAANDARTRWWAKNGTGKGWKDDPDFRDAAGEMFEFLDELVEELEKGEE
jgi:hypothetical protein